MTIRDDIIINWSVSPRIIEILKDGSNPTSISMQDLYDTVRHLSFQPDAIDKDEIIDGAGKELLGNSVLVGLTIKLLNAKVKFENRENPPWTVCNVLGGNLVAENINGESMDPIEPSAFVTTTRISSSSATLINLENQGGLTSEEHNKLMTIASDVDFIKSVQNGRWKIINNQMIFYKDDNITEIMRFNLFDINGNLTMRNVAERRKVLC